MLVVDSGLEEDTAEHGRGGGGVLSVLDESWGAGGFCGGTLFFALKIDFLF